MCADGCYATSRWDRTINNAENNFSPSYTIEKEVVAKYLNEKTKKGKQPMDPPSSDCQSTFQAVQSDKKFHARKKGKLKNLDETGQFGEFCARHGTILSLLSMTTGENMGTIFF